MEVKGGDGVRFFKFTVVFRVEDTLYKMAEGFKVALCVAVVSSPILRMSSACKAWAQSAGHKV
jgi:hypothetical protein